MRGYDRSWLSSDLLGRLAAGAVVIPQAMADSKFTGKIHWVQIDLGDDDNDHFIDPDERFRIAMAQQ